MKSRTNKVLSLLLSAVFTLSSISYNASGITLTDDSNLTNAPKLIDENPEVEKELREKSGLGVVEIESLREESVKHFQLEDGSYQAVAYGSPIHRKNAEGKWINIDNRLTIKNNNTATTSDGYFTFTSDSASERLLTLNDGEHSISFGLKHPNTNAARIEINNHIDCTKRAEKLKGSEKLNALKIIDNTTKVYYNDVVRGLSLEYILEGNDVKENIILGEYTGASEFSYYLTLENLYANLDEKGTIVFANKEGEQQYSLSVPYMYDANGQLSHNVKYSLAEIGHAEYLLTIKADDEWLKSNDRTYPVIINPSVNSSSVLGDTYVNSSYPTTNYGQSTQLWVGTGRVSYIKVSLPLLPTYALITYATLTARYHYNVSTGSLNIGAYQCLNAWNETQLTWSSASANTNMGLSTIAIDTATATASASINANNPGYISFLLTDLVKEWYTGTYNYGIGLKYIAGSNSSVIIESSEASNAYRAYYSISYRIENPTIENGTYFIKNGATGRYIDIEGPIYSAGTNIHQWDFHGGDSQRWLVNHLHNGYYVIRTLNDLYYLGVNNDSTANNAAIVLRNGYNHDGTQWKIEQTANGRLKITAKCCETINRALASAAYIINSNGIDVQQRDYVNDSNYKDEWYMQKLLKLGLSTDNYTDGCSYAPRGSYHYARTFINTFNNSSATLALDATHHYNNGSTRSASKEDFSANGAISNDIDFMIYIGHGLTANDESGNKLHYNCSQDGTPHTSLHDDPSFNLYNTEVHFGSSTSSLRWAWLYTCNFLTPSIYVSDTTLKNMITGAHIVLGYASTAFLCDAMVTAFASKLSDDTSIIDAYFWAGHYGEATITDGNDIQKALYIQEAREETIYSTPVHYSYSSADVNILVYNIQNDLD